MWALIATCRSIITYGLYVSFKIGQFIVTTANSAAVNFVTFLNKLVILLTIVFEDFLIFLQDLLQRIYNILGLISYFIECLSSGIETVFTTVKNIQHALWTSILMFLESIINGLLLILKGIGNIFVFIKQLIILFGDGVWFIVVFIPKSIISLVLLSLYYLSHLCVHISYCILDKITELHNIIIETFTSCFNFFTDVPVESLVGIIIAGCFIYIFLQFYTILNRYIKEKIYVFTRGLRRKYNQFKQVLSQRTLGSNTNQIRHVTRCEPDISKSCASSRNADNDERFCVICQDRIKCILILPCKHLCLCSECSTRIMYYSGSCPICRKRINRTMKIFT